MEVKMSGKRAILAIDDDVTQLQMYKNFLGSAYDLTLVKSASEALGIIDKIDFDLILLDIEMPHVSGFEFLHEIRKKPRFMTKPIIIVSSHTEQNFLDHAQKSSAFDVLTKPVNAQGLINKIEEALKAPPKNILGL
jgi:CheY-like chemotaxis protein